MQLVVSANRDLDLGDLGLEIWKTGKSEKVKVSATSTTVIGEHRDGVTIRVRHRVRPVQLGTGDRCGSSEPP